MHHLTKIKDLLGDTELSVYELKQIIDYIVEKYPAANFNKLSDEIQNDIREATYQIQTFGKRLVDIEETIIKELDDHYERVKKTVETHSKKMSWLKEQLGNISNIQFPRIELPYNMKEAVELVERLNQMSPETKGLIESILKYKYKEPEQL